MTAQNRANRISKLQNLLKKSYKPVIPVDNRPLMEHLLYACLLENAPYELADEALARLEQDFFDWNEVRVTTITELTEVLSRLPDPTSAAIRLKKNLHGLFESTYSFDLEELRKQNLGKALQRFERLPAMSSFILSYITQHGLGGHAIPLDSAALRFFWLCDIINENELKTGKVTGLERAIPKNKGVEFSSLLHQAAVAINVDPTDATARAVVLELNPALDQQLADHVAAVKVRREAKAKAKEAEAEAVAVAEAKKAEAKAPKSKTSKTEKPEPAKATSAAKATSTPEPTAKAKTEKPAKAEAPKEATKEKTSAAKKPSDAPAAVKASSSKSTAAPAAQPTSPKKAEVKKPDAKKIEAKKPEPQKPESKKAEPKKADDKKTAAVKKPTTGKTASKSLDNAASDNKAGVKKKTSSGKSSSSNADSKETKSSSSKSSSKKLSKRKPR